MTDPLPGYESHDALALADLVRRREITPAELLEAAILRIEAANSRLNAVIRPLYERARKAIAVGLPQGPFTGVPFLLKDLGQMLAGERLAGGCMLFADFVPDRDSTLAARYQAAGFVIAGKTNTPELGCSITTEPRAFGPSRNPWNIAHTPGGSSGGAAAAVASGMVPVAHASDGGGSIRVPAALCGLYGFKPSRARNPAGPDFGESLNGMSSNHCVSWTVRDSAALLDATHGPEPGDPYQVAPPRRPFLDETRHDPARLRIAYATRSPLGGAVAPAAAAAAEAAARLLADLGHTVEAAAPEYDAEALHEAWRIIVGTVLAAQVAARAAALKIKDPLAQLEPVNAAWVDEGRRRPATDYFRAETILQTVGRSLGMFFMRHDVLLTPAAAGPAPLLGTLAGDKPDLARFYRATFDFSPFTVVFNATGGPAASVPFASSPEGLPLGIQIGADLGRDDTILALSGQIERARPWRDRSPPGRG